MNSVATKPNTVQQGRKIVRGRLDKLREEMEDLEDYLDVLEARASNVGKPTYTTEQVRARLGLKAT